MITILLAKYSHYSSYYYYYAALISSIIAVRQQTDFKLDFKVELISRVPRWKLCGTVEQKGSRMTNVWLNGANVRWVEPDKGNGENLWRLMNCGIKCAVESLTFSLDNQTSMICIRAIKGEKANSSALIVILLNTAVKFHTYCNCKLSFF